MLTENDTVEIEVTLDHQEVVPPLFNFWDFSEKGKAEFHARFLYEKAKLALSRKRLINLGYLDPNIQPEPIILGSDDEEDNYYDDDDCDEHKCCKKQKF